MKKSLSYFICLLFSGFLYAEIPQSEKQALYAIAESVHLSYNWNEQTPIQEWEGVNISTIDGIEHVTSLNLFINSNGSNYTINFSNQIANLSYLEDLSIRYGFSTSNNITFKFDFNNLIGLSYLKNLSWSASTQNFNDQIINTNQISQLLNLEDLRVEIRRADFKIPNSISQLTKLKKLYYRNLLDYTYTPEIFQILSLEDLTIMNGIYSVDETANNVANLSSLKSLSLEGQFSDLPDGFYDIPNLENLTLNSKNYNLSDKISNYANRLESFNLIGVYYINHPVIGSLVNLENLYLKSSYIYVDTFITQLTKLKTLKVESDYPIFFADEVSQLTGLEELFVKSPESPISEIIYTIPNLKLLILNTNQNVSENVNKLQKLEHIQIQFSGNISSFPHSISTIQSLKNVDFITEGIVNQLKVPLPTEYFTNWPHLQQFWSDHDLEGDMTNRFLNNPDLESLYFTSTYYNGNLHGKLNLCQNPKINLIRIAQSKINEVDLRNIESLSNNNLRRLVFSQSDISKFIVDDVDQFNDLVNSGKIIIENNNSIEYSVVTSSEPCQRVLAQNEIKIDNTVIYPNPVKDILTFQTNKAIENVEILTVTGQRIKVENFGNKANLSDLPSGLYIIKWSEDGIYKIQKILKK